ncbi:MULTISPECIES: NifU family protein [unclassified Microbacterium]|uniref:NifU family protein n=1 Tax=unclassified Microbacterium TaxID=2609290 RepID=UPI0012FE5D56
MAVDPDELQRALQFVRPRLRGHAGDMTAVVDDEGNVTIEFYGACERCPAMAVTYAGLVQTYVEAVPGVRSVRAPQISASPQTLASIRRRLGVRANSAVPLGLPTSRTAQAPGESAPT